MHILLPKTVEIKNARLSVIFHVSVAAAATFLVARFIKERIYYGQLPMDNNIEVALWVNGVTKDGHDKLSAEFERQLRSPLCTDTGQYDYWFSESWRYTDHTCIPLCPVGEASMDCASLRDIYVTESPSQAVLLTQVQDTWMLPGSSEAESSFRFMPAVEALSVGLQYAYNLSSPTLAIADPWFAQEDLWGTSSTNVLTVLLDSDGQPNRTLHPEGANEISLSVTELLELAGRPNLLDEPQDELGQNKLDRMAGTPFASGPAARLSGADLVLKVDCKNFHEHEEHASWGRVICYLSVRTEQAWTNLERVDLVGSDGALRHRQYHGLRVRVETSGYLLYYDFNAIYVYIVTGIVVMGLPSKIILFIAMYCLGHMSTIYTRMLIDANTLSNHIAGLASRLMSNSVMFSNLEDEEGGISKEALSKHLKASLKHRGDTLDEAEINNFVNYCFTSILQPEGSDGGLGSSILKLIGGKGKSAVVNDVTKLSIDDFNKACSSLDPVSFECVVKLFDRDRKRHFLERLFTPKQINKHVHWSDDGPREPASKPDRPPEGEQPHPTRDWSTTSAKDLLALLGVPEEATVKLDEAHGCQDFVEIMLQVAQDEKKSSRHRHAKLEHPGPVNRPGISAAAASAVSQQQEDLARVVMQMMEREKAMQAKLDEALARLDEISRAEVRRPAEVGQSLPAPAEAAAGVPRGLSTASASEGDAFRPPGRRLAFAEPQTPTLGGPQG